MRFKKFIIEGSVSADIAQSSNISQNLYSKSPEYNEEGEEDEFTKQDILEMIGLLEDDELQDLGDYLMDVIYDDDWDDLDDLDDLDEQKVNETKYFSKKSNQVNREKKLDKATKRKRAKERKKFYKKNKAKIKRKQKLYRKAAKRQPNQVRHHR